MNFKFAVTNFPFFKKLKGSFLRGGALDTRSKVFFFVINAVKNLQPRCSWQCILSLITTIRKLLWSNGLVITTPQSQFNPNPSSKPMGCSKVNSAFHPSKVDQMSTRNSRKLSF